MAEIAEILGESADAQTYSEMHIEAVGNYHKAFYNETTKSYSPVEFFPRGSQTSQVPLHLLGNTPNVV